MKDLRKFIKVKATIVRAIPLPPISIKKGPVPICPPNKSVKSFFDKIGFLEGHLIFSSGSFQLIVVSEFLSHQVCHQSK